MIGGPYLTENTHGDTRNLCNTQSNHDLTMLIFSRIINHGNPKKNPYNCYADKAHVIKLGEDNN